MCLQSLIRTLHTVKLLSVVEYSILIIHRKIQNTNDLHIKLLSELLDDPKTRSHRCHNGLYLADTAVQCLFTGCSLDLCHSSHVERPITGEPRVQWRSSSSVCAGGTEHWSCARTGAMKCSNIPVMADYIPGAPVGDPLAQCIVASQVFIGQWRLHGPAEWDLGCLGLARNGIA